MKIQDLGEFGLIDRLAKVAHTSQDRSQSSWRNLLVGIGDDAAAWYGDSSIQLATTDSLIQDVHFSLDSISFRELGWKALAVNLSDIAAMGGVPRYALVTLALPSDSEVDDVTALYEGMVELAQQFGVAIVGGDCSRANIVAVTITVLGNLRDDKHMLTRYGAEPGDKVAVTGYLGGASAGEEMLREKLEFGPEATAHLKEAFLRPYPRIAEGQLLVESGVKTAIDISDGLISDLNHVCQRSGVQAQIEVDRVPISPLVKDNFANKSLELALAGGEDYELLFTAKAEVIDRVKKAAPCPITVIGEITTKGKGKLSLVNSQGNPFNLSSSGWEHFRTK